MKKRLLSLSVILVSASFSFAQVQPTNASFENWTPATGFSNPDGWETTNYDIGAFQFETVTEQTTGAQDGASFARLTSVDVLGQFTLPGMLSYGIIDIVNATITGGVSYTDRPEFFRGYYNYNATGDMCGIGCYFTKWNGTSADTVATGVFYTDSSTTGWTFFDITITYQLPDVPDTMNIIISSSGTTPVIGSVLDVDNLYFEGLVTGKQDISFGNRLEIYPNPSKGIFNISANNITAFEVLDITGKVVYSASYTEDIDNVNIDMRKQEKGIYMLRLKTQSSIITRKLILD